MGKGGKTECVRVRESERGENGGEGGGGAGREMERGG
jgi:hypothetical protein